MNHLCIMIGILLSLVSNPTHCQEVNFQHLSIKDGLPTTLVFRCVEDSRGFIWFCTNNGLVRYDGIESKVYGTDFGLSNNVVWNATPDEKGGLYLGTHSDGVPFYINVNGQLSHPFEPDTVVPINNTMIKNVAVDTETGVWYHRTNVRHVFNNGHVEAYTYNSKDRHLILEGLNGRVYLSKVGTDKVSIYRAGEHPQQPTTYTIVGSSADHLDAHKFIMLNDTSCMYFNGTSMVLHAKNNTSIRLSISDRLREEEYMLRLSNGHIIIIGADHTLVLDGNFVLVAEIDHAGIFRPSDLLVDSRGNYWFATLDDGVYFLPCHASYTKNIGGFNGHVVSIFKAGTTTCFGDTEGRILIRSEGRFVIKDLLIPDIVLSAVRVIKYSLARDQIYILLNNHEVYATGTEELFSTTLQLRGIPEIKGVVNFLVVGDTLFAPSRKKKGFVIEGDTFVVSQFTDRVVAYYRDTESNDWFGTKSGLFCADEKVSSTLDSMKSTDAVFNKPIQSFQVQLGLIWVILDNYDVYAFDPKTIQIKHHMESLPSSITFINALNETTVLLGTTHKGLIMYDLQEKAYRSFKGSYGLSDVRINDMLYEENIVTLATSRGIFYMLDTVFNLSVRPPLLNMERIMINEQDTLLQTSYTLKHYQNNLEIEYRGIDFANVDDMIYEISVNSGKWQSTQSNSLKMTALRPGNYSIAIQAVIPGELTSNVLGLSFFIKEPWWNTFWFKLSVIIALLFSIITLYRYRTRRLLNKANEQIEYDKKIARLEMNALQAQMNPHFVYNTLHTIQAMIESENKEIAVDALSEFSHLIRKFIDVTSSREVMLNDEVDMLRMYLGLQQIRLGDRLAFTIDIDSALDGDEINLPSAVLQSLIENAIKHGRSGREVIVVNVEIKKRNDDLYLAVSDNGRGMKATTYNTTYGLGKGLSLVRDILDLFSIENDKEVVFNIKSPTHDMRGTRMSILIKEYI